MNKKVIVAICAIILVVGLGFGLKLSGKLGGSKYPQIVYIDNELYYATEEKCDMVPKKMPDGVIETFVPKEIMPDMPDSANFGEEQGQIEYMYLDEGSLIVHIGDNWYYCSQESGK